jgi:hypothetical protein
MIAIRPWVAARLMPRQAAAEKTDIMAPVDLGWLLRWSFVANVAVAAWVMFVLCIACSWVLNRLEPQEPEKSPGDVRSHDEAVRPSRSRAGSYEPSLLPRQVPERLWLHSAPRLRHTGTRLY